MNIISVFLVSSGTFVLIVAALGAIRLPDFYTRSHALGIVDTVGTFLFLAGIAVHSGLSMNSLKIILIIIFIQIANPAVTHILIRAAMRSGLPFWKNQGGENLS